MMTYREYKPTWLQQKIWVDEYGRDYNLSDVPMTIMTRNDAYHKRGLTLEQIDDIYEEWILEQEELHNGKKEK
jgi:hypothetical protein